MKLLHHPNIVRIHEVYIIPAGDGILMSLEDSKSLSH